MIEGLIVILVSTDLITLRLIKGGRRVAIAWRRKPAEGAAAVEGGS
jgi:hypothetical protein